MHSVENVTQFATYIFLHQVAEVRVSSTMTGK